MRVEVEPGVVLEALDHAGPVPDAPVFVMVHGFGGSPLDFDDHLDALTQTHRVVRFWHRGHGPSDRPAGDDAYTLDRLASDAFAVVDALGVARFRLLGWSLGGMVARRMVLRDQGRIERLVLMDTSAGPPDAIDPEMVEAGGAVARRDGMATLKVLIDSMDPLDNPAYRRLLGERPGYAEYLDGKFWSMSPESWAGCAHAIAAQDDDLDALASVAVPTLVVVGALDRPFVDPSHALAATIPGARLVVVPDAGHSPQYENPGVWLDAITSFLAEVPAA